MNTILVWSFHAAPEKYRNLSPHGGDEDWIALLPPGMMIPAWMDEGTAFGCFSVSETQLDDGHTIVIGAHA